MQSRDVETSVRAMQLFAKILCLIMAYLAFEFAIFWLSRAEGQPLGGISARLILTLGSSSVFCLLPTISVWWNGRVKANGQQQQPDTQHVVLFSLLLLPVSAMWLSDPAIRMLLPYLFPVMDGETVMALAPMDNGSSIALIFCMTIATPALVSVCLVSLNSWKTNLLFEAYHLAWSGLFLHLHADNVLSTPLILFHHSAIFVVCMLIKPPILRAALEFALHPVLHLLSHPHVHTHLGALPEGSDTEADAFSGFQFQHSKCSSSPLLAALWTLLAGKKCRCHVLIFDLLLVAIFGVVLSCAFFILLAIQLLFGTASLPMLLYPAGSLLVAAVLSAPFALSNYFGVTRLRRTPLCSSGPIPFVGIKLFFVPMLMCGLIAPFIFWLFRFVGSPLQPLHELLLVTLSSMQPYIFVRACPHAFRPAGWILFLCLYFWSNWKFMTILVESNPASFYSSDGMRLGFLCFVPLYAFFHSLLSRNASHSVAFKPFLDVLATCASGVPHTANVVADPKVATSYWQAQAALGTANMQSIRNNS